MTLQSPVGELQGIGDKLVPKFATIGIKTIGDLLAYYPRRYEDYSVVTEAAKLRPGKVTIKAKISSIENRYVRRGMVITEAIASDSTASVQLVWFNQSYLKTSLKKGQMYFIAGDYGLRRQHFSVINPSLELVSDFPVNTARIIPVYSATKGLTSTAIRRAISRALPYIQDIPETLPEWLVNEYKLMPRKAAIQTIHFPASEKQLFLAKRRLGFDELFELRLASLLNKKDNEHEKAITVPYKKSLETAFTQSLPFSLTNAQNSVLQHIYTDMQKPYPMNRMIEGDVGSGKTVVATLAALMAIDQGYQVAFMVPTEILARQHESTISNMLTPLGLQSKVDLLVGSIAAAEKDTIRQKIATGKTQLIIGTHALIQEKVTMHKLALVIIDEQHRFGVEQRKTLRAKAGHMPHVLSLTATPIPRSLAFTLYGEVDVSLLNESPAGRQPVITKLVSPNSRAQLYKQIDKELDKQRQMFVVTPRIFESDDVQVNNAEKMHETLSKQVFKHRRVGLLHGKMKASERNKIMQQFINHKLDILVATTVIEVGIDVPNATIMLIESADRFGLAQIHQLRGRVGRGEHQGYCYLMMSDSSAPSTRLREVERSVDGFKLAELDLELRGPGAFTIGTLQHGHNSSLKIADLKNKKMLEAVPKIAQEFLEKEKLQDYPALAQRVNTLREIVYMD